uniref:Dihydrofolate reductase n=1 Tax=Panagrolaimus sp. JU765 TaxID=591449 RepID=A0AC34QQK7_9BILA
MSRPINGLIPFFVPIKTVFNLSFLRNLSTKMADISWKPMDMIVAVDAANGISVNNSIPWHLPNEYRHFQATTMKTEDPSKINAVILGRKCWESIPEKFRPLKKRINVILSRTMPEVISDTIIVVDDFEKALKLLATEEPFKSKVETIWNVGGKDIYALGLAHPSMRKLVITRIDKTYLTDVQFPEVDWENFELNNDFDGQPIEEKGVTYKIQSYTKKSNF